MTVTVSLIIGIIVGAAFGLVAGWLLGKGRSSAGDTRLEEELRQQLGRRESEVVQIRGQLADADRARAAAEANRDATQEALKTHKELHERAMRDLELAQAKALADMREIFGGLSAKALEENAPKFLQLAEQNFEKLQEKAKSDLAQRQEAIKTLVEPLKQQLENYQQRLQQAENAQAGALGDVKRQLENLSQQSQSLAQQTQKFREVLISNQARGRWGEETLRRVVEAAGMSVHCEFKEQTQAGDSKPDLVVQLPEDRVIIVDAKVPDLDFLGALDAADPVKRAESLGLHATKLKSTIKDLADRDYPRQFPNSLDYVVLFMPAESLFSAALEGDRDLIVWAASKRILLATPASLIALLRSVSVSWQQYALSQDTQRIAEAARELYSRVVTFTKHFEEVRNGLRTANEAFNRAVGSYERMVRPQGEKLLKLGGGGAGKEIPEVEALDGELRLVGDTKNGAKP
ncbi:MAG: DNA recombination protein RmuC [Verrucomicrobia bacterium]|nr:MAG: DNA recombination protein RmuC [Verrucomicrobiota bacterium]